MLITLQRFLLSNSDVQVSCYLVDVNVSMYPAGIEGLHGGILPTHIMFEHIILL